jgi:hypothetical protein
MVDDLLAAAGSDDMSRPVAVIVPHAGYQYSGPIAASGYAAVRPWRAAFRTAVLVGPSHFVPVSTPALPAADVLRTPLGDVPVDAHALAGTGLAVCHDGPHAREHSLEVQLPFLQRVLDPGWAAVPLLLGRASGADRVADCLDALAAEDVLVVVSSDLSHYHDHRTAQRLDRRTADAIEARDPGSIRDTDACGAMAVRGVLTWALRHNLSTRLLDLRTSADTAGDPSRVVGYGAFSVSG